MNEPRTAEIQKPAPHFCEGGSRNSHPLEIAKGGATSVGERVSETRKGGPAPVSDHHIYADQWLSLILSLNVLREDAQMKQRELR